jgi:hypothetical protein
MALSNTLKTDFGITLPDAYCRIEHAEIFKNLRAQITVTFYAVKPVVSEDGEQTEAIKSIVYGFPFALNGDNVFRQGYEFLKTLPEFAEAKDC